MCWSSPVLPCSSWPWACSISVDEPRCSGGLLDRRGADADHRAARDAGGVAGDGGGVHAGLLGPLARRRFTDPGVGVARGCLPRRPRRHPNRRSSRPPRPTATPSRRWCTTCAVPCRPFWRWSTSRARTRPRRCIMTFCVRCGTRCNTACRSRSTSCSGRARNGWTGRVSCRCRCKTWRTARRTRCCPGRQEGRVDRRAGRR